MSSHPVQSSPSPVQPSPVQRKKESLSLVTVRSLHCTHSPRPTYFFSLLSFDFIPRSSSSFSSSLALSPPSIHPHCSFFHPNPSASPTLVSIIHCPCLVSSSALCCLFARHIRLVDKAPLVHQQTLFAHSSCVPAPIFLHPLQQIL
jgi:hypothetical protein